MASNAPDAVQRRPLSADERRYYREWFFTALASLAILTLFTLMQWGQSPGLVIFDQFQRWRPAVPGKDIVVIEVDDHTLESRGGWPIKRTIYAELLRKLADSGNQPRAIGFDILFPDPMPEDAALAEQMQRHKVYLAAEQHRGQSLAADRPQVSPLLAQAARGIAHVNLSFESDGSLRGSRLFDAGVPQLTVAMSGKVFTPQEQQNSYRRLHLVHPQVGFPSASLADVLAGQVPLEFFRDKYVLIGSTAPSLGDHFPTLYSGQQEAGTPGVMLHANLLSNLLNDELIQPVPAWVQLGLAWLSMTSALIALLVLSPLAELLVNAWTALCTLAVSYVLLVSTHYWFDPGLCVIGIGLLKPAWAWRRNEMIVSFMSERAARLESHQRQRKKLREGLRLRHFTSDTLLQYSRVLDRAIAMVSDRLSFLQRLVAEVPLAMLVTDEEGRILLANPAMQQIVPHDFVQKGAGLDPLFGHLGVLSQNLQMLSGQDHLVQTPGKQTTAQHFILRVAPIVEGGDQPLWVLSLTDVTEMRQFQSQRDQTLQLLSHDMRTPIASIIALSRKSDASMPEGQSSDIHRHARTLLNMMDDFIFSIHAQAPQYKRVELLIDNLVDEAVYQVRDLAQAKNMQLVVEQGDDPQFVLADQRLFTRVLVNLLVNAIRYGEPDTEICIHITHDPVFEPNPFVRCSITNVVARAAELKGADTGRSFGLGLDFVHTVMQKHAGHIELQVVQAPGALARVDLALPLVR